eukprot:4339962-Pleurochrysis_carterae.AAC.1
MPAVHASPARASPAMNADRSARQLLSPPAAPAASGEGSAPGALVPTFAPSAGAPQGPAPRSASRAVLAAAPRVASISSVRHHALARS